MGAPLTGGSGAARFAWAESASEATVTVVHPGPTDARDLLARLGPAEAQDPLFLGDALALQDTLYEAGTAHRRAVVQVELLPGAGGEWWALLEPNGYRASEPRALSALAAGGAAASFFWNVNAVMRLMRVDGGTVTVDFDPLLEVDAVPEEGRDLPFDDAPRASALALLERWTGVRITEDWFLARKPTFIVDTETS